jgi:hypothetical protein
MKLQVHRLHDDAHATLTEHAVDAVPARKYSPHLHAAIVHHRRRAPLQALSMSRKKPPLMITTTPRFTLAREGTEANHASKSTDRGIRNPSGNLH